MEVKAKKLVDNAVIPQYAHTTDAGLDLVATSVETDEYGNWVYHTGLAFEIPDGYVGLIFPRSSLSKYFLSLTNCVGVIDSGYRGEVMLKFNILQQVEDWYKPKDVYKVGDKIGQMIILPYPKVTLIESDELSESDRGEGCFGSTGK